MPVRPLELPAAPPAEDDSGRFLFSAETMQEITKDPQNGQYTAENCPERLKEFIIFLLAADWSDNEIKNQLHVHHRTVARIRDNNQSRIGDQRAQMVRRLRQAGRYQVDRLVDHPDAVPMPFAAKTAKELIELAELLDGRATARVEHVEPMNIYDDWDGFIEKQLEPGEDVIELPAETGSVVEKKLAIKEGSAAGAALGDGGEASSETDLRSEDRGDHSQPESESATTSATDCRTETSPSSGRLDDRGGGVGLSMETSPSSGRLDDRGGGVGLSMEAAQPATDKSGQKILVNSDPS